MTPLGYSATRPPSHPAAESPRLATARLPSWPWPLRSRQPPARSFGRRGPAGGRGVKVWFEGRGGGALSAHEIFVEKSGTTIAQLLPAASIRRPASAWGYRRALGSPGRPGGTAAPGNIDSYARAAVRSSLSDRGESLAWPSRPASWTARLATPRPSPPRRHHRRSGTRPGGASSPRRSR